MKGGMPAWGGSPLAKKSILKFSSKLVHNLRFLNFQQGGGGSSSPIAKKNQILFHRGASMRTPYINFLQDQTINIDF